MAGHTTVVLISAKHTHTHRASGFPVPGSSGTQTQSSSAMWDHTVEVRGGLQPVRAVNVVSHLQLQSGAGEEVGQGVFSDGRLLQNHHSILIIQLKRTPSTNETSFTEQINKYTRVLL